MKQQIYRTAENEVLIEKALMEVEHKNVYLKSRIVQVYNLEHLKTKIKNRLIQPKVRQIVWLPTSRNTDSMMVASRVVQPLPMSIGKSAKSDN